MLKRYQPTPEQPWNVQRVVHLHRRAGFAANWSEIQRDLKDGPDVAITRLLHASPTRKRGEHSVSDDPSLARRTSVGNANDIEMPNEFVQMSSVICDAAVGSGNINRLKAWWLYRMLFTPDPLGERLTLMWHNHFATSNVKVADVGLMRQQNAIFRQFSRAPFAEMLCRVAKDPALLVWLDADANRKEHPNENLAREIMELFSLGVGNYTEDDIKQAARALTGWSVNKGEFRNYDQYHDDGEKTIFGRTGKWNGDDLLRLLLEHPATARRLAFRVCELFMGERAVDDAAINELADGLRERDLDIGWTVEAVMRSDAFFSDQNIGNRVLGPVEFIVGAVRALEMFAPPPSTLLLAEWTAKLGEDLFYPPNVFGWPGGRSWMTSRALIGRANFATSVAAGTLRNPSKPFESAALAEKHGCGDHRALAFYCQLLLGRSQPPKSVRHAAGDAEQPMPERARKIVVSILASPEAQLG